jgi:hypothetical protein
MYYRGKTYWLDSTGDRIWWQCYEDADVAIGPFHSREEAINWASSNRATLTRR